LILTLLLCGVNFKFKETFSFYGFVFDPVLKNNAEKAGSKTERAIFMNKTANIQIAMAQDGC